MSVVSTDVVLSSMELAHVDEVIAIEQQVFGQPWSNSLFRAELEPNEMRAYSVALIDGSVVGYTGLSFVEDVAHVMTMAVDPRFQKSGIATRLMQHNMGLCKERKIDGVTLEVRVSNEAAIKLYRKFGFAPAGVRRRYYSNPTEDALILWSFS